MKGLCFFLACSVFMAFFSCTKTEKPYADLILKNGQIWTVDPHNPWVSAIAIKENQILSVGSEEEIESYLAPKTRLIDLDEAFVLPGFIDCHTHFIEGGFSLESVELRKAESREDFIRMIEHKAKTLNEGEWILNGNWDHQQFDPPSLPQKEWIDHVTPNNPVCVNRHDGHMVLLNSLALEMCGISHETVSPTGGEIIRDPRTGQPTGILVDAAMELAQEMIPDPSLEEKIHACRIALELAASKGITSLHDMAYSSHFEIYSTLLEQNELTARIRVYIQIPELDEPDFSRFEKWKKHDYLEFGGLKGFIDGSLGSNSALFFDPYIGSSDQTGLLHAHMLPDGVMKKRLLKADELELQVAVHAIGDKANHLLLDMFQEIFEHSKRRDRRWRIEHAQHLTAEDMERFSQLEIIASVQPYHAIDDGRWAESVIGRERIPFAYPFRSLKDKGALLVCGSDWTVAPLDPIQGIYAAVTRRTLDGKNPDGWVPEEKISLEEAIKGYTIHAAYCEFSENKKGSLESGKLADLVVLDRNLFEISPENIAQAQVLMTVFDGKIVFQKQGFFR